MATKILYVITKANWGGAQRYVYDLAVAARDAGYDVAVAYGTPGELDERLQTENIQTFPIAGLGRDVLFFKDISAFFSLFHILKTFQPTVLHLNSSKVSGLGALAGRLLGIQKIIFTVHAWAFNEKRPVYQKVFIGLLAWITVLLSTRTIVVSHALRKQIVAFPFVRNKIIAIPNGTRPYNFLDKNTARHALVAMHPALAVSNIEQDTWIGTVAELHPVKGLPYAIDAIGLLQKQYPNLRYLIAGTGEMQNKLKEQIAKMGLERNVFILGHVMNAPLYNKAFDVFVLPSLSEAFGITLLEAGLAELPVVATRVGGIPEILSHSQTGLLVPPRNPTALAEAIDSLLTNASRREMLGQALQQHVEKEFSMERIAQRTFAAY